jgi:hypothetical protein
MSIDTGWRNTALLISPSGSLCWGFAFWKLSPAAALAGVTAGAAVGVLGAWLFCRQAYRASGTGAGWWRWLPAFGVLVLLFLALVIVPAVARVAMR